MDPYLLSRFHAFLCNAILSVPCSLVIICWEKADLLVLLCFVFLSIRDKTNVVMVGIMHLLF